MVSSPYPPPHTHTLFVLLLKSRARQSQRPLCRRAAITHLPAGSTAGHITATTHVQIITTHMHYYFFPLFFTPESTWHVKTERVA